jgi:IS30 family transposase
MLKTFYPKEYYPYDDKELNAINEKINELNRKIYNNKVRGK